MIDANQNASQSCVMAPVRAGPANPGLGMTGDGGVTRDAASRRTGPVFSGANPPQPRWLEGRKITMIDYALRTAKEAISPSAIAKNVLDDSIAWR